MYKLNTNINKDTYTYNEYNINLTVAKIGNILKGTDGKDKLTGTSNWDVFFGGKGNDTITGKKGQDVVVYDKTSWGNDTISKTSGNITLLFNNIKASDIVQKISGTTMTITKNGSSTQKITIKGWNDATHNIVFATSMTQFNKFIKEASPTQEQSIAARNEVFKKAGLASV